MDETTEGKTLTVEVEPKKREADSESDDLVDVPSKKPKTCAHFAIYDGHGGRLAAEYAQKHLHGNVISAGLPRELLN
ncbi:hypothetical protein Ahy_A05g022023 [Arachis hypogaea]|uniref:PPM-type phosphatase domain-containing protein n=1 Tax=Arachis hypogaea TaxID=3818 RepID=A0A445CZ86_ARAHY|nr:hypothetical protein Ahy_A05g022023 [Arachis hypogaea]